MPAMPNNERSAEWCRGAVAVLGRMVDECSTVFDSDLPHITQGNLEDYLAEYAKLLAAAEAREAGEQCPHCDNTGTAISSNQAGDEYTMRCCCEHGKNRDKQPTAAEVKP